MRRRGHNQAQPNTPAGSYLSVLDIGDGSVRALVVQVSDDQVSILGRGMAPREAATEIIPSAGNWGDLGQACEQALRSAEDATARLGAKIIPDAAVMSVPACYVRGAAGVGQVKRVAFETPIMLAECAEPLALAGRRALRHVGRLTDPDEWVVLDATVATWYLSGHSLTDPVGFRGRDLAAMAFVAVAPRAVVQSLVSIADTLQLDPSMLVAAPLALAAVSPSDGLIVQVQAAATDLILVHRGVPLVCDSIEQGGAAWAQALQSAFHLSPTQSEAVLRAYRAGRLDAAHQKAVQDALQSPLDAWAAVVVERLQSWTRDHLVDRRVLTLDPPFWSPDIYVCGRADLLPWAQRSLAGVRWLSLLPFPRAPQVRPWDSVSPPGVQDLTEQRGRLGGLTAWACAAWARRGRGNPAWEGMLKASLK